METSSPRYTAGNVRLGMRIMDLAERHLEWLGEIYERRTAESQIKSAVRLLCFRERRAILATTDW